MSDTPADTHPRLVGFPQKVQDDYKRYMETKDSGDLSTFVLSALGFLSEDSDGVEALSSAPDDTKLIEQSVIDSLAVAELMFLLEDLFEFSIDDEKMREMETVGDLKAIADDLNNQKGTPSE
ncbi:acyl carrier protein [Puniceicoccus vermicola]|uniref:Acyl carrier protein n=1 Tax=Puniceicoccus vermicola TaxID=388746 RepID=A0A7X1AWC2_9BACT|nr:acyl carrier protein [Puniceicoccus vermicola]MBC2601037.1 acyl carrier protein [Puniceicoccus vermicola]